MSAYSAAGGTTSESLLRYHFDYLDRAVERIYNSFRHDLKNRATLDAPDIIYETEY
ncbi:hypothetical protein QUF80_07025 [Desulfococcaceae bacterium HSG8]|nr:hypothetical protein [Desulfococcaceae bacterium HSG8]